MRYFVNLFVHIFIFARHQPFAKDGHLLFDRFYSNTFLLFFPANPLFDREQQM